MYEVRYMVCRNCEIAYQIPKEAALLGCELDPEHIVQPHPLNRQAQAPPIAKEHGRALGFCNTAIISFACTHTFFHTVWRQHGLIRHSNWYHTVERRVRRKQRALHPYAAGRVLMCLGCFRVQGWPAPPRLPAAPLRHACPKAGCLALAGGGPVDIPKLQMVVG